MHARQEASQGTLIYHFEADKDEITTNCNERTNEMHKIDTLINM